MAGIVRRIANPFLRSLLIAAATIAVTACEREERALRLDPPVASALDEVHPMPTGIGGGPPQVYSALEKPFASNAYELSQGKRLYNWMGCPQCQGNSQSRSGPPLLDGWWQYGPDVVSIFVTIRDGRPGGMPSFRDKLTTEQIWQVTGYIQTLGAYSAKSVALIGGGGPRARPAGGRAPAAARGGRGPE